jgi:hypothetical protein
MQHRGNVFAAAIGAECSGCQVGRGAGWGSEQDEEGQEA